MLSSPGFKRVAYHHRHYVIMETDCLVVNLYLSCVSTPLVITPPAILARLVSLSLATIYTVSTPTRKHTPVFWPGFVTLLSNR